MIILGLFLAFSIPILMILIAAPTLIPINLVAKLIIGFFSLVSFIVLFFIVANSYLFSKKYELFMITPDNFNSFNYLTKKQRDVLVKADSCNKDYVWSTALAEVESELNKKLQEVQAPARNEAKIIVDELFTVA